MAGIERALSSIGFGAFKIGRNEGIKYPSGYELPDMSAVERLLNGVLDCGISYIDTAPAYGLSEERIGQAIAHRRHECTISTKVGESFENGASTHDYSREAVQRCVERSLQRLGRGRLDLVFVHARRDDVHVLAQTDVVEALCGLRDQAVIAAIGLSGYTAAAFRASFEWADAIMLEYHPLDRTLEPVIAEAAQRRIAVVVKKPLASGRLKPAESFELILGNPGVTSVVVGSLDPAHMEENMRIAQRVRGESRAAQVSANERIRN